MHETGLRFLPEDVVTVNADKGVRWIFSLAKAASPPLNNLGAALGAFLGRRGVSGFALHAVKGVKFVSHNGFPAQRISKIERKSNQSRKSLK